MRCTSRPTSAVEATGCSTAGTRYSALSVPCGTRRPTTPSSRRRRDCSRDCSGTWTTARGLPLANWDKATYDKVSEFLATELRIPKDWFYDLNSYDAAQLLGGVIGVVATALCWNRADTESFARLVGGMGVSALARTNPLLLLVTVVALARAFHKAHHTGEYAELVGGQLKGGVSAGATLVAASQVAALGGPAGLALLVGMAAGALVYQATQNVSAVQIGEFVAERPPPQPRCGRWPGVTRVLSRQRLVR